jgi:hypothetical protein
MPFENSHLDAGKKENWERISNMNDIMTAMEQPSVQYRVTSRRMFTIFDAAALKDTGWYDSVDLTMAFDTGWG